jgi:hypothetical protein
LNSLVKSTFMVGSLSRHAGLFDDGAPFGFLVGNIGGIGRRRPRQRLGAVGGKPLPDVTVGERIIERGIEFDDDLRRRTGGRRRIAEGWWRVMMK